jgi:phospholipid-binding lipoprotein MlaA
MKYLRSCHIEAGMRENSWKYIMKTNRTLLIFFVFIFLSFSQAIGEAAAQKSFPDFLGEDLNDENYLDEPAEVRISDPLESMNRAFFEINDQLYEGIFKPVNKGYSWVLPLEIREAIGHFFVNITMPIRLINSLLQGDLEKSGVVVERFLINTTLGVYGFADIADVEFDIKPRRADFDQTLGKWGLGEGIYLCWPVLGPSSVRGTVGLVVDAKTNPVFYFIDDRIFQIGYYATNRVNNLSLHPNAYEDLKRYSLDPYIAARQAYYDYRKALVEKE